MIFTSGLTSLIISVLALALCGFVWWQNRSLAQLKKIFFTGTKTVNLEEITLQLIQRLKISEEEQRQLKQNLKDLQQHGKFAIQKIGLVRFNPFGDGGGNFSFCLALLDARDNGIVVTSMYGREQNRIYAKKINGGQSDNQLNE
jgi:hypothetical protein